MSVYLLVGGDHNGITERTEQLFEDQTPHRFDLHDPGFETNQLLDVLTTRPLFGQTPPVLIRNAETLPKEVLHALNQVPNTAVVVMVAARKPAGIPKNNDFVVETYPKLKGRDLPQRVTQIAGTYGVTLTAQTRNVFVNRSGHNLDRIRSVCHQLQLANITKPTAPQINILLGTTYPEGVPWEITDHVLGSNLKKAVEAATNQNPFAVCGYLHSWYKTALIVQENPDTTDLAPFVKQRSRNVSKKYATPQIYRCLQQVVDTELQLRQHPQNDHPHLITQLLANLILIQHS